MMEIQGEKTVNIEGKDYWTVASFGALTQRSDRSIRILITKGNRQRKLKAISVNGRVYIEENEIFDFAFCVSGRPANMGDFVERFYMENGELLREEACIQRCQV